MDLNKLTKKDLIDIIEAHDKKPEQKDFDDVKKRNTELVQEVFDKKKRVQELEKELESKTKALEKELESKTTSLEKQITQQDNAFEQKIKQQEAEYVERLRLKDEQYINLSKKFNDLAALFDEHIKGFDDVIATNKLFLRTMGNTKEILESKIKKFNGSDEGGTN